MPVKFETISQGFVFEGKPRTASAVAAGPRCVRTESGDLLCSFMVQSALGVNNFVVMLARSRDGGITWQDHRSLWPHLASTQSLFGSISRAPSGDLFIYGITIPIDQAGETFWSEATQGMKQNSLFWARSGDEGRTWTEPKSFSLPYPGSAEAPGPMCITRDGVWLVCYAPYNTFNPNDKVERDRIVVLRSEDQGSIWTAQPMIRFDQPESGGAEAWIIELADGRLLGTCWNVSLAGNGQLPNPYALSLDGGRTWLPTHSTGILGQSTALLALPDGRSLMAYNQRKHGEPGVWVARARPGADDFGLETNQVVWRAPTSTQKGTSGEHDDWQDFAFGEPCLTLLENNELLLTFWCIQPDGQGIRFLKLRLSE
jgi:hypothetical protein